jgi:hypothetical protein
MATKEEFEEKQIRIELRTRPQLIAALGKLNAGIDRVNRWASEVDLAGKHCCDLVVGDSSRTSYTLIELEDATPTSIFKSKPALPYWADRFNHGFAQVVDWLCLLDGQSGTPEFRDYWGQASSPQFTGVLLVGRRLSNDDWEGVRRLEWRSAKVRVNSHPVLCMTYDDMVERLLNKLDIGQENPVE